MSEGITHLYADNHLFAVNKPAGMLTQPSGTGRHSAEAWAKSWIKETYGKPGAVFLEAVHRLDREVSGVVLFARTSKALSRLQAAMRERRIRKIYLAWVQGVPPGQGVLLHYLRHGSHRAVVTTKDRQGAREARLSYRRSQVQKGYAQVEIELQTGRYHQIRAQFAAEGYPVAGDVKYGARPIWNDRIALHHLRMELIHPVLNKQLTIEAPMHDVIV